MGPKKQRKQKGQKVKQEEDKGQEKTEKKGAEKFSCECGKVYGSLAAVHTHINNKHSTTPAEKKNYKSKIRNPKKNGQPVSTSIRMKDIAYDEKEAELMCHADITLKNIYEYFKETEKDKKHDILIDMNEDLSDDSDDIDDVLENSGEKKEKQEQPRVESRRQKNINEKVGQMKRKFGLTEINRMVEGDRQLQSFKIDKFRLNMKRQLSKFFIIEFAARVELSLEIYCVLRKSQPSELVERMKAISDNLFFDLPRVKKILEQYYEQWVQIRQNYTNWKSRQEKKEDREKREGSQQE